MAPALLCCFPLGIALVLLSKWQTKTKVIVIAVTVALWGLVVVAGTVSSTPPSTTTTTTSTSTTTAPAVTTSPTTATTIVSTTTTARPPVSTAPPTSGVYFASCGDAKAAGAAPLHRGDPGYRSELDRDGDGVACES